MSEDSGEESEDEEDQLCPDDPQRLKQQHQLVCQELLKTNVSFLLKHFIHQSVIRLMFLSCAPFRV